MRSRDDIAVLGLGLMGGSVALALRATGAASRIVGYDTDGDVADRALAAGAVDAIAPDVAGACRGAGLAVLAAPVSALPALVERAGEALAEGALLVDLGGAKRAVVAAMDALPAGVRAVGGHPMCGKERGGFEHADPTLFRDAAFVLCETARTDGVARRAAEDLVAALGARAVWLSAAAHDRAAAAVSHVPYLLSLAAVAAAAGAGDLARELAASGYRDTTRIAASDPAMMVPVLVQNADEVVRTARSAAEFLGRLVAALETGDVRALTDLIRTASGSRLPEPDRPR